MKAVMCSSASLGGVAELYEHGSLQKRHIFISRGVPHQFGGVRNMARVLYKEHMQETGT